jgi:outer membrane receptor protein involved in Fe transport
MRRDPPLDAGAPPSSGRLVAFCVLLVALLLLTWSSAAEPGERSGEVDPRQLVGLTLAEALEKLSDGGVPVVFSSALVRPAMKVATLPRGDSPRELVADLLRPHGLEIAAGPRGRLVVVRSASMRHRERPPEPGRAVPVTNDEIEVAAAAAESGHGEPLGAVQLDLDARAREMPRLGGDLFRSVGSLPGGATTEVSSRVSIRGGRNEDVLVLLDGLELVAPYHLQEFDAALGIVPAQSLARAELITDLPPAEYGDRMGGVLDLTSRGPQQKLTTSLGLGSLFAEAEAAGTFAGGRGSWLGSARSGNYRLALEANGRHEDPRFWDFFGRADFPLRSRQSLQLRTLFAADDIDIAGESAGDGPYTAHWEHAYVWLTHSLSVGSDLWAESILWGGRLERSRFARAAVLAEAGFDLSDRRSLELTGGKSTWHWAPDDRSQVDAGVEVRQIHSAIDYHARRGEGALLSPPASEARFADEVDFDQTDAFLSVRSLLLPRLTLEGGLRYDRTQLTDEQHVGPRLHLAWRPGRGDQVVRAAWGQVFQSQRPYELQVEDGETEISPAERSEHYVVSYERRAASGSGWRIGAYQRETSNPRPRYESLFDTVVLYPELAPARVRIAADRSRATGLELAFFGAPGVRFSYSAASTFSTVADRADGRWIPRATDEPYALRLDGRYRLPRRWWISAVWLYHTGWPTTTVEARPLLDDQGRVVELDPVLGAIRGDRMPDYHRLDLRVGREWDLRRGRLLAYLDLQNVYDRENLRGFERFGVVGLDAEDQPLVSAQPVSWGGFLPSFGLRWTR